MKFRNIEIKNFRSMSDQDCKLNFDKDIISLVGKNESGKTNIINALADIKFMSVNMDNWEIFKSYNNNRYSGLSPEIIFTIEFDNDDLQLFNLDSNSNMGTVTFSIDEGIPKQLYSGILKDMIEDERINANIEKNEKMLHGIKAGSISGTNQQELVEFRNESKIVIQDLKNYYDYCTIPTDGLNVRTRVFSRADAVN